METQGNIISRPKGSDSVSIIKKNQKGLISIFSFRAANDNSENDIEELLCSYIGEINEGLKGKLKNIISDYLGNKDINIDVLESLTLRDIRELRGLYINFLNSWMERVYNGEIERGKARILVEILHYTINNIQFITENGYSISKKEYSLLENNKTIKLG